MEKHVNGVHKNITPYSCEVCEEKFNNRASWYAHRRTKHSIRARNDMFENANDGIQKSQVDLGPELRGEKLNLSTHNQ